jgi:uncharacterized protein
MTPYLLVHEMKKMLRNLNAWLSRAEAHAQAKKFDTLVLVQSRLAPDMLSLVHQVRIACDTAKFAAARVTGREPPSHADTETTFAELSERIAKVLAYLDTFAEADFTDVDGRSLSLRAFEGKSMMALDYLVEHAVPNFFFHVTTAYAILRHNGVDLGKRDFIGALSLR